MTTSTQIFPHAPKDWDAGIAQTIASNEHLQLAKDHWVLIQCLQEYYDRNEFTKLRIVTDALEEKFHSKGGMKYLHRLLPEGPVSRGCKLAGLEVPAGSIDESFGTTA